MHPGRELRRLREKRGWSVTAAAVEAGLSPAYLSRVERGERDPTWSVLERLAALWDLQPVLTFVASPEKAAAEQLNALSPELRLCRQDAAWLRALRELSRTLTGFAATGAAAAVVQGAYMPIERLELLVLDEDAHLEALVLALRRSFSLFVEVSPEGYRQMQAREWVIAGVDAVIDVVAELPPTCAVLLDGIAVPFVALPALISIDERAAHTLRSD